MKGELGGRTPVAGAEEAHLDGRRRQLDQLHVAAMGGEHGTDTGERDLDPLGEARFRMPWRLNTA